MLKNIGSIFEKRKRFLIKSQNKNSQLKEIIQDFLKEKFGDGIRGYSFGINHNSQDNSLIITANNKIVANELMLELAELSDRLRRGGIQLSRILIR